MINGQTYHNYGFDFLSVQGNLDMPSRLPPVVYDWGDHVTPLVNKNDIAWADHNVYVEVLHGEYEYINWETATERLYKLPDYFTLTTTYGAKTVSLKEVNVVQKYGRHSKVQLVFTARPSFSDATETQKGGGDYIIDEWGFYNDFGIIVETAKVLKVVGTAKKLSFTVYQKNKEWSVHRGAQVLLMQCAIPYNNRSEMATNLQRFQKLLSQENQREIIFDGYLYKCFLTEGFQVQNFKSHVKFTLKMNVTKTTKNVCFVKEGFVKNGFVKCNI